MVDLRYCMILLIERWSD